MTDPPASGAAPDIGASGGEGSPGARRLDSAEVSEAAGVPLDQARRFWQALGIPAGSPHHPTFGDADVRALRRTLELVRSGVLDESLALSMTRAVARTTDRLAAWQSSLVLDAVLDARGAPDRPVDDVGEVLGHPVGSGPGGDDADSLASHRAAAWLLDLLDDLEPLLVYSYRRHMSAALNRLFAEGQSDHGPSRVVGFADMVGFTSLVTRLSDRQLGRLVERFETLSDRIVGAHGGTVVKTVGDEVLFTSPRVDDGAAIALDLVEALTADPAMPDLRVGLSWGEVLDHHGDVFGTTVNRASRITEVASPQTVVVDESVARGLSGREDYRLGRMEPRPLRGLGTTGMWALTRR